MTGIVKIILIAAIVFFAIRYAEERIKRLNPIHDFRDRWQQRDRWLQPAPPEPEPDKRRWRDFPFLKDADQ